MERYFQRSGLLLQFYLAGLLLSFGKLFLANDFFILIFLILSLFSLQHLLSCVASNIPEIYSMVYSVYCLSDSHKFMHSFFSFIHSFNQSSSHSLTHLHLLILHCPFRVLTYPSVMRCGNICWTFIRGTQRQRNDKMNANGKCKSPPLNFYVNGDIAW